MTNTYSSVKDLRWSNAEHTAIDCLVFFDKFDKELPFNAVKDDPEPHGREIFNRCVSGEFGEIASFQEPLFLEQDEIGDLSLPAGWHDVIPFLDEANKELHTGTDRGLVLVWAAMIDEMLYRLLKTFLIKDKITEEFVGSASGAVSSFSARTKLCYLLGLIAKDEMQVIDSIRDIRNGFAHKLGISLQSASLKDKCQALDVKLNKDRFFDDPRRMYSSSCARVAMLISERIALIEKAECRSVRVETKLLWER